MAASTATILLWGLDGAGKRTTLDMIAQRLRPELRGEIRQEPTRLDPTVRYAVLPILLDPNDPMGLQIELVAVPGGVDQAMTRKQLLDGVDGILLVLDCAPERIAENRPMIEELRGSLAAYGRTLEGVPLVLQYNKRDVADPFAIEALHRDVELDQAAVFETIATTGHGILPTLTTISKHVVRERRSQQRDEPGPAPAVSPASVSDSAVSAASVSRPAAVQPTPSAAIPAEPSAELAPSTTDVLEAAILAESDDDTSSMLDWFEGDTPPSQPDWSVGSETPKAGEASLRIVSVGAATVTAESEVRLPLVLGEDDGRTRSVVLRLRLEDVPGSDPDAPT